MCLEARSVGRVSVGHPERGSGLEELRPLRRRKSGSETPELQSMSCEESQKLRSLEGQPRVAERGGEHRSQRLHVPVRHGLKFWSLRPRLPTARCSHFPPPWPGTCRTQHRRSCVHRNYIVGMGPRRARPRIIRSVYATPGGATNSCEELEGGEKKKEKKGKGKGRGTYRP